jgi:hypothetical protein
MNGLKMLRAAITGVLFLSLGTPGLSAQKSAQKDGQKDKDTKPDVAAQAQAMAQQQEIQTLVRYADSAMSGQAAPADFPIQFQNDFLKAQGTRVWVPIILTLDPAKTPNPALTLYLRVVPRGMTAPAAPAAARPRRTRARRTTKTRRARTKIRKEPPRRHPRPRTHIRTRTRRSSI